MARLLKILLASAVVAAVVAAALGVSASVRSRAPKKPALSATDVAPETVSVEGVVDDVVSPTVFLIGAEEPVLVVHRSDRPLDRGTTVKVVGRIERFDGELLEEALRTSSAAAVERFRGRRCLVATDLRVTARPSTSGVG